MNAAVLGVIVARRRRGWVKIRPFWNLLRTELRQCFFYEVRGRVLICRCLRHRCRAIAGLALVMLVMGLVRVRIFELRLVMEVQGASQTLRDAVGYRSHRFLRRQRARQVKISQVFFWELYDQQVSRSEDPSACNFGPCLQRDVQLTLALLGFCFIQDLLTKVEGLGAPPL